MLHETSLALPATPSASSISVPAPPTPASEIRTPNVVLSPGEWIRAVSNFDAPFGFDRMPTVWG